MMRGKLLGLGLALLGLVLSVLGSTPKKGKRR